MVCTWVNRSVPSSASAHHHTPMRRSATLTLLALGCSLPAADSWILRPEDPWSYGWEERHLANLDGVSMPGFSRTALPVSAGVWGEVGIGMTASAEGNPSQVPGGPPVRRGVSAHGWAEIWGAWGPLFIHLRPEAVAGGGTGSISNPLSREAWTGQAEELELDAVETAPRATLGITGFEHILALSNEPFRWGEGIFGGVMMGQAWRGFPHVVLASRGPLQPAPEGSWLEPLALGYEFVAGQLVDAKPETGDGVQFAGFRMAVRWEAVTLAWSKSMLFGGDQQPDYPLTDAAKTLIKWRSGNDGGNEPGEPDPNRFASLGLRVDWPERVAWSVEYGIDDQNVALRLVSLTDRLYDAGVPVVASGAKLDTIFSEEMLAGGYRKKYLRATSRLLALTSIRQAGVTQAPES